MVASVSESRFPRSRHRRFGRRRIAPHVCIVDSKPHVRRFLAEAFQELGFVTHLCADWVAVAALNDTIPADLVALGVPFDGADVEATLRKLAHAEFDGMVMLIGGRDAAALESAQRMGEKLQLTMVPALGTPFRAEELADRVASLLPLGPAPSLPVDVEEALSNGWLEVWYQPKIDPRSLLVRGAEALCRLRHPVWGIVPPAYFITADGCGHNRHLAEFIVARTMQDWRNSAEDWVSLEIAVNLPMAVLQDPAFLDLLRRLPRYPGFAGMLVEVHAAEFVRDLPLAQEIAAELRSFDMGIAIDNLSAEWSSFAHLQDLFVSELKVDRQLVHGCAEDRLKHAMCATIIDLAQRFGVRTVAEGVEKRADLLAVRELGFDLVQGFLLAKPMDAHKFAHSLLNRRINVPG